MKEVLCPYDPSVWQGVSQWGCNIAQQICGKNYPQAGSVCAYDLIFSGFRSISARTRGSAAEDFQRRLVSCGATLSGEIKQGKKIYYVPLEKTENGFILGSPERVLITFADAPELIAQKQNKNNGKMSGKPIGKLTSIIIKKRLEPICLRLSSDMMRAAEQERMFVARFNQEKFARGVNPTDKPVFTALSALYSIAFHNLSLQDVYKVSRIFSGEEDRELDDKKKLAASELAAAMSDSLITQAETMGKMCKVLTSIEPPEVNIYDIPSLSAEYTCYSGMANMAAACVKLLQDRPEVKAKLSDKPDFAVTYEKIEFLLGFGDIVKLCDNLAAWRFIQKKREPVLSDLEGWQEARRFAGELASRK